jgi:hypothetical protein
MGEGEAETEGNLAVRRGEETQEPQLWQAVTLPGARPSSFEQVEELGLSRS